MRYTTPLMLAAGLIVAAPASAQDNAATWVDPALAVSADYDDDGFPWGLLGLLGLAGLIPRKRRDDHNNRDNRVNR